MPAGKKQNVSQKQQVKYRVEKQRAYSLSKQNKQKINK